MLPGARRTAADVDAFARAWERANRDARSGGAGPLWVALGDSTAQGVGAPAPELGYVGQLLPRLRAATGEPWRLVNLSRSGARLADVVAEQLPRLAALEPAPALVTCAAGANDLLRTPPPVLRAAVRALIARLPPGAVIATLPQGLRERRARAVNALIRAEAPAAGLRVADVWAHTGPPWRGRFASDWFHPNEVGYAAWADAFAAVIAAAPPSRPA